MTQLRQSTSVRRRTLLRRGGALGCLTGLHALASAAGWMPYPDEQVVLIQPQLSRTRTDTLQPVHTVRINPVITDFQTNPALRQAVTHPHPQSLPPLRGQPPRAYVRVGQQIGVDPWLLFGVALQESRIAFGKRTLPYPWTLCVRGRGMRFGDYNKTLNALAGYVQRGVTNVDCGAMQVNWYWHRSRLVSFERALDPYPNLVVGARILRGHYDARRNWHRAVALYHTGAWDTAAKRSRGTRYADQTFARLARLGLPASRFRGEPRHG